MFDINRMHFNDDILRDYCRAKEGTPIWGEVQHSLWESKSFRSWRESKVFPRIFTWNDLLRFPNEYPIGDPYLYLALIRNLNSRINLDQKKNSVAVFPKFRRRLSRIERVNHYIELMTNVQMAYPEYEKVIRLHPEENFLQEVLTERFDFQEDWSFQSKEATGTIDKALTQLETICFSTELVTDYMGVHVLRRLVIANKQSKVIGEWLPYTGRDSIIQEIFEVIASEGSSDVEKINSARILLGSKWLCEQSKLAQELGFLGMKKFAGGFIQSLYRTKNKARLDSSWKQ